MSVCTTCGKKYSKWTAPVSAHGICGNCFEAELTREHRSEPQIETESVPITVPISAPSTDAPKLIEKALIQPRAPFEIFVETLGVTLALFSGRILLDLLGPASKPVISTQELVANSLRELGWILLVVCLLNRTGAFQWRLPDSKKGWRKELEWGALLLVIGVSVKAIAWAIGRDLHLRSEPSVWHDVLRNHNTWITYQIIVPVSALYQELIYRVYMQSRLTQILGKRPVAIVFISSLLFAAMHNYAPLESLNIFFVGLLFGASYQLNGKIPRLVIAHTANNIIAGFACC